MTLRGLVVILLLAGLVAAALGREPGFEEYRAVHDSLSQVPPKWRAEWLQKRGLDASRYTEYRKPESTGLRLVGKWGRGPSFEVTGRGDLVALSLGSEVALLDCAEPHNPVVLSEIQLSFLPRQTALHDSFLLTCGNGIEVWNIADSTQPEFCNVIPRGVGDFSIVDTFLYFTSYDTFWSYSIGNPASPCVLGFFRDSGYMTTATRNTVVLRQPGDMLGFVDVTDPATPHQVGTYPGFALPADARGNICCAAMYWSTDDDHFRFEVLDISDPANVRRLGAIDSVGGWDIHLSGPFAFVSGDQSPKWEFTIVDIQDSTHPQVVSACATPGDNYGVWADWTSDWAYAADRLGLAVIDISNLNVPVLDTVVLKAHLAQDVWLDGGRAYVANEMAGLKILDVSDPTMPVLLGSYDTTWQRPFMTSVVARDSFAYIEWSRPKFRTLDVSDPTNPGHAGTCELFGYPEDMVIRDSFVYCAELNRFQVVNVARPREPELVGSCGGDGVAIVVQDSFAYTAAGAIRITNIARPDSPYVVSTIGRASRNLQLLDTILVCAPGPVMWFNVADPGVPVVIDSIDLGHSVYGLTAVDSTVYASTAGNLLYAISISDLHGPRIIGQTSLPYTANRIVYAAPYLHLTCWDAGVCIYETVSVGVMERRCTQGLTWGVVKVEPNPTTGRFVLAGFGQSPAVVTIRDATGRVALTTGPLVSDRGRYVLDASRLVTGVYFVEVKTDRGKPGETWGRWGC